MLLESVPLAGKEPDVLLVSKVDEVLFEEELIVVRLLLLLFEAKKLVEVIVGPMFVMLEEEDNPDKLAMADVTLELLNRLLDEGRGMMNGEMVLVPVLCRAEELEVVLVELLPELTVIGLEEDTALFCDNSDDDDAEAVTDPEELSTNELELEFGDSVVPCALLLLEGTITVTVVGAAVVVIDSTLPVELTHGGMPDRVTQGGMPPPEAHGGIPEDGIHGGRPDPQGGEPEPDGFQPLDLAVGHG